MCTGLEIALVGSLGLQTLGSLQSAKAQREAGEVQAQLLQRESQIAQTQAAFKKRSIEKEARSLAGRQRASIAKSGVTESGSVADVMQQSAEEAELAALSAQYGADLSESARGFEAEAAIRGAKAASRSTLLSGLGGAASTAALLV